MRSAWKFGVVALVAFLLVVVPGGGPTLEVALTVLSIAFFTAIALFGYRLYREHSLTLDSLDTRQRLVLYGSIGLAFLTFTATPRLFNGAGVLLWLALLGLASYGVYWVIVRSRRVG
jgi:uncharacterized protein involved in cysteine biosynthesis